MCEEVVVRVPADQAWALVGERFGDIGTWAAMIVTSTLDSPAATDSVRTSHTRGFGPVAAGVIKERLICFDPAGRSLAYEWVEGCPSFIVRAVSRWSVHEIESGNRAIRVHATLTLHPIVRPFAPLLRWQLRHVVAKVLEELAYRLETGALHPRKLAATFRDIPRAC